MLLYLLLLRLSWGAFGTLILCEFCSVCTYMVPAALTKVAASRVNGLGSFHALFGAVELLE